MQIIFVVLSFVFGFLTSLIDFHEDERKQTPPILFILISSFIFLYLLFSKLFALVFGVFLSLVFAKKLDSKSWKIFLIATFLFLPFFIFSSFSKIEISIFSILSTFYFFTFSLIDEIASDYADKKIKKKKSLFLKFLQLRPFLELSTLAFSFYTFDFDFFACIFSFDLAYNLEKRLLLI